MNYEALWFTSDDDYHTKEFGTREEALAFYEVHKADEDKKNWWVTERDPETWEVLDDII
jgi:hypothetical protein